MMINKIKPFKIKISVENLEQFNKSTQSFWTNDLDNVVIKLWVSKSFRVHCPLSPCCNTPKVIPKSFSSSYITSQYHTRLCVIILKYYAFKDL